MNINEYDESGHTPLMNAAIEGDVEEVKRLLSLGADPDIGDESWGTTKAVHFAGRLAKNSARHREVHELLLAAKSDKGSEKQDSQDSSDSVTSSHAIPNYRRSWPYETNEAITGRPQSRLKSSVFYLGGVASVIAGVWLISNQYFGGGILVLFIAPCLLLYPAIRWLFGGRDSVAAAVTTVVVEEYVKHKIRGVGTHSKRKR